jgi:hypothetical protein
MNKNILTCEVIEASHELNNNIESSIVKIENCLQSLDKYKYNNTNKDANKNNTSILFYIYNKFFSFFNKKNIVRNNSKFDIDKELLKVSSKLNQSKNLIFSLIDKIDNTQPSLNIDFGSNENNENFMYE